MTKRKPLTLKKNMTNNSHDKINHNWLFVKAGYNSKVEISQTFIFLFSFTKQYH